MKSNFSRLLTVFAVLGGTTAALGLSACGSDDPPPPKAELRFYHASETLGTLEVEVGDEVAEVAPGTLSDELSLTPDDYDFDIRSAGAAASLVTVEDVELDAGSHVFIIAGNPGDASLNAFAVGTDPPQLEDDEATFQVVSVVGSDLEFDVYGNDEETAETVARYGQSEFYTEEIDDVELRIYNVGDDPTTDSPLLSLNSDDEELTLEEGGVYVVLIAGGGGESLSATLVQLQ